MTSMYPDDWQRPSNGPFVRVSSCHGSRYGVVATTEEGLVVSAGGDDAVVTPLDGAQSMVTAFDAVTGMATSIPSVRVASYGPGCEKRVGVYLRPGNSPTFTLGRNEVWLGDFPSVGFAGDEVRVKTALLAALRDGSTVRVGLGEAESPRVTFSLDTGEVRARAGDRETVARVDHEAARVGIIGDLALSVSRSGRAEVRRHGTTFVLDPDGGRTKITCVDGVAEIVSAGGLDVCCARTGWRVTASTSMVMIEPLAGQMASMVWDRRTGDLEAMVCAHRTLSTRSRAAVVLACDDCGASLDALWVGLMLEFDLAGLRVRWSCGTLEVSMGDELTVSVASAVRMHWGGKDFVVDSERVVVSDLDEDWYVTADGRIATGGSTVSAGRAIDGTLELTVRSEEDDETILVWAGGVCLDDGLGLRTMLDPTGRVTWTPTSRADHNVIASPSGVVKVTAGAATVDLARTGAVRLRHSEPSSGSAELTVLPCRPGRARYATVTRRERFSVDVTCFSGHGFAWTTMDLGSRIGHCVLALGDLVRHDLTVGESPSATSHDARVVQAGDE